MAKRKGEIRYRKIRTDIHTHERTAGIGAVGRDLLLQGILANIAGLLERSVRSMARMAGVGEEVIEQSLAELQRRGLVRWWPDLEVLWVVEAADEQAEGKAWKSVLAAVKTAPAPVRDAFRERYPDKMPDGGCDKAPDPPSAESPMGDSNQEAGIREQDAGVRMAAVADPTMASPIDPDNLDLDERDDPEIRETGQPVGPPTDGEIARSVELWDVTIQQRLAKARARYTGSTNERVASCALNLRSDEAARNLHREVMARERGIDGVLEVLEWAWHRFATSAWNGKQREAERTRIVFAFRGSATYWAGLVAERAEALAKAEVADLVSRRREETDRVQAERAARARGSPESAEVDIDAVTRRLRRGRATG
jgi:hypothetical protein